MSNYLTVAGLCLLFLITGQAYAQEDTPKNGVYLETYLLRHDFNEGWVSINYERAFGKELKNRFRIGIYPDFETLITFPITYTRVSPIGPKGTSALEWGGGIVFRYERFQGNNYYDVPAVLFPVMYRYQAGDSGFFARAGINLWVSWPFLPAPSLSVGYRF